MKTITKFIYLAFAAVVVAMGAVTANGAPGNLFASVNAGNTQNGGGFIYQYTPPGVRSIFAFNLDRPRGLAFDSAGNLFLATNYFNDPSFTVTILKITPGGVPSIFSSMNSSGIFFSGLAIDRLNNVFVMEQSDTGPSTIYEFTPGGIQSTFGSLPGTGWGLAFDSAGNLFAADGDDQTIYRFTPDGTRSIFVGPTAFGPGVFPAGGLAFDRFGNLFVAALAQAALHQSFIFEFAPDGTESTFATGLNTPRGLAFDRSGSLFVAELIQTGPGDILKFNPGGIRTVFASGIGPVGNGGPEFLAFQLLPTPPHPTPPPHP